MNLLFKAQTRFMFHAHIKIKISVFYEDALFDELFAVLENVDKKYNSYQSGSYIDQINKNAGVFTQVDEQTTDILNRVCLLSDYFEGEYDITIMPLIRLWGFYKDNVAHIPSTEEIEKARQKIDYRNILIDNHKVCIGSQQEIITGSFIKAFAIDQLRVKMIELGINDAIINAGGSTILAINNRESHPYWQVAVRHPENDELLFNLNISDCSYSTSSQSKTFLKIGNENYGHIISPKSGYPSQNKQVGIISTNCMDGDIISTGLFNQTSEGFIRKINELKKSYPEIEGYHINKNGEVTFSDGFSKFIV